MKESLRLLPGLSCMALCLVGASTLHATTFSITGSAWENGTTDNVPPPGSSIYGTTPTATFTVTGSSAGSLINFDSRSAPGDYTLGGFLNFTTITAGNAVTFLTGGSHSGDSVDNILFQFLGTTTLANNTIYTFAHDDGLVLTLNGAAVINTPGPTAPVLTDFCVGSASFCSGFSFSALPGTYNFALDYAEVFGPPAVLSTDLPLPGVTGVTPEPSTLLLLGSGLAAVAAAMRRRRRLSV